MIFGSNQTIFGNLQKCSDDIQRSSEVFRDLQKSSEVFGGPLEIFGSVWVVFGNLQKVLCGLQ